MQKPNLRAPTSEELREFAEKLINLRERMAPNLRLAACADGIFEFPEIEQNSRIDPLLINEICAEEIYKEIRKKSLALQKDLFANEITRKPAIKNFPKDKGQRKACLCAPPRISAPAGACLVAIAVFIATPVMAKDRQRLSPPLTNIRINRLRPLIARNLYTINPGCIKNKRIILILA